MYHEILIYSLITDVLHLQNNHGTQGRLVGVMVSHRLLTNDRWRLGEGKWETQRWKHLELPLGKKHGVKHVTNWISRSKKTTDHFLENPCKIIQNETDFLSDKRSFLDGFPCRNWLILPPPAALVGPPSPTNGPYQDRTTSVSSSNEVPLLRFHTCILQGRIPFMTHSLLITNVY